jgi:AraC family transcriptional regulator
MLDTLISGQRLGLPMVDYIAGNRQFNAVPMTWHDHRGHEILMMLQGANTYGFKDKRQVELTGGHFMVIPAGTVHRGMQDVRTPSILCAMVVREHVSNPRGVPFTKQEERWLLARLGEKEPMALRMPAAMLRQARLLHRSIIQHGPAAISLEAQARLRLQTAMLILEAASQAGRSSARTGEEISQRIITHLEQHHAHPIQISDLTNLSGCSRAKLFTVFKNATGLSPNDWLLRHRIQRASKLLIATDRKLEDIAHTVGIASSPYFCRLFRKYMGKTPGDYRQISRVSRPELSHA